MAFLLRGEYSAKILLGQAGISYPDLEWLFDGYLSGKNSRISLMARLLPYLVCFLTKKFANHFAANNGRYDRVSAPIGNAAGPASRALKRRA